jgi:broad specificity phosphatase PhoE
LSIVLFITHPEVEVDPRVPVPRWRLSQAGIARMRHFVAGCDVDLVAVFASAETKAIEAAGLLAARYGLPVGVEPGLGENDRSATGFLPPAEFEAMANAFFARPEESVRGWERAIDAQSRIAEAVDRVLARAPPGPVAIVAHGGVGTLLHGRYRRTAIYRAADQPFQGHSWAFDRATRRVLRGWQPIAPKFQG